MNQHYPHFQPYLYQLPLALHLDYLDLWVAREKAWFCLVKLGKTQLNKRIKKEIGEQAFSKLQL